MALTLQRAKELGSSMVTEDHLIIHSLNVCYAMGAMARHFGADEEHWMAVGWRRSRRRPRDPQPRLGHLHRRRTADGYGKEPVHRRRADGHHPSRREDASERHHRPEHQELYEEVQGQEVRRQMRPRADQKGL